MQMGIRCKSNIIINSPKVIQNKSIKMVWITQSLLQFNTINLNNIKSSGV